MNIRKYVINILFLLLVCQMAEANPVKQKYEEATLAYSQGKYQEAVTLYEEVIKLYPKLPQAYFFMGMAHRNLGTSLNDITWLFEKAIELDPQYAKARENLGKIFYELGRFDEAQEQCMKTLEIDPSNVSAKLSLGWIFLLGKSEPAKAITYFESALETHKPAYAYLGLGMAYFMTDERAKVLEMITVLRQNDQEPLAQQLELMVRNSRTSPQTQPGTPLFTQNHPGSALVQEKSPSIVPVLAGNESIEKIPVRLSGKLPNGELDETVDPVSAEERIQALKRRTQRYSKESGY